MTIYEKTYRSKLRILFVLALLLMASLLVDQWVLLLVDQHLTDLIPFFQSIERISDSLTNNLAVRFLFVNSLGILLSSLYFKNQKWSTFFLSWLIVFVGAALITNYLKVSCGRIRPEEVIDHGLSGVHYWFAKGDSFPSGHASYYCSLFIPVYYFFDRLKPVLGIPTLIALGRVIQKAHFLSDILMSLLIVLTLTIISDLFVSWLSRQIKKIAQPTIQINK